MSDELLKRPLEHEVTTLHGQIRQQEHTNTTNPPSLL